jgi:Neurotransmitter-gated ion-channel transmembrane region.
MLLLSEMIPAASDSLSKLGIFFNVLIIEMVVMIFVMCHVARMYNKSVGDKPISHWMRTYIYDGLSYRLYVRKRNKRDHVEAYTIETMFKRNENALDEVARGNGKEINERETEINEEESENNHTKPRVTTPKQSDNESDINNKEITNNNIKFRGISTENGSVHTKPTLTRFKKMGKSVMHHNAETGKSNESRLSINSVATSVVRLMKRKNDLLIAQRDGERKNKRFFREWKVCAMTFDRMALISFTMIVLVTFFAIFGDF